MDGSLHAVSGIASFIVNFSHWRGVQYLQNTSKILLCVSADGEIGAYPRAALECFFLPGLTSLLFLINTA